MAGTTRQQIIERTVILLAKKGLQGASFSQIIEESGAPRGSLYHHFPGGKDELVLEAIDLAGMRAIGVLDGLQGRPAAEIAAAFIAQWRAVLERADFNAGCAVLAVTVAAESAELRDRAGAIFARWRARLGELFAAGGVPASRAPALAAGLIAACEGAVVLSRGERSMLPFELATGEQLALIRAAAASAKDGAP